MFAGQFTPRLWPRVQVLLTGALLARGPRTVTAVQRVMGLVGERYHYY